MGTTITSVAALFVLAGTLQAQTAVVPEIEAGDLIRITDASGSVQEGVLVSIGDRTLIWRPGATPESAGPLVPAEDRFLASVTKLERYGGEQPLGWKGFAITVVSLAAVGGAVSAFTYEPCEGFCILAPSSPGQAFAWGAVTGGIIGIPIGAVIGLKVKRDMWLDVDVGRANHLVPSVGVDPGGGVSLGITLRVRD